MNGKQLVEFQYVPYNVEKFVDYAHNLNNYMEMKVKQEVMVTTHQHAPAPHPHLSASKPLTNPMNAQNTAPEITGAQFFKALKIIAYTCDQDRRSMMRRKLQERVVLDDENRIIEYKTKGAGLQLSGTHARGRGTEADTIERNEKMLELLAQIAYSSNSPINDMEFAERFIEETGSTLSVDYLKSQFFLLENEIHKTDYFDQKTEVRMCFITNPSIPEGFQKILREDAHPAVDHKKKIICYKSKDGTMELGKMSTKKAEEGERSTISAGYGKVVFNSSYELKKLEDGEIASILLRDEAQCEFRMIVWNPVQDEEQ
ncbi:unnamed protein product [Caenorhabditis brenneri]